MEYGHYIETTGGGKTWFAEGCTYCNMSTGGEHEINCPLFRHQMQIGYREIGEINKEFIEDYMKIVHEVLPVW